ncbi:unnamed protein product [Mytilus coruscus]|uniref:Uncharacterized protein n=1 Tax=Mytilus coruscus TaxID=42192 RepID=A0A6J8BL78_MYTCO|nr:unnamed protein product [Mytilus coruscus]
MLEDVTLPYCQKITLFLPLCKAFEIYCPAPSERDLRASALCNKSLSSIYSCLDDENRRINTESCTTRADFAPPGNKYVLRGRPDFTPCAIDRYQPIRLWSNVSSQCIYKKSKCIGNGQFLYKNGTEELDTSCRCDYTRGYDFINKPRNACFCVPSEEDCSCYKKNCPQNGVLTPDYTCATDKEIPGQNSYACPIIVHDRLSTENITANVNSFLEEQMTEYSSRFVVFVVSAICTFLIAVEGFLLLLCYNGQDSETANLNIERDDDYIRYLEERRSNEELAIATEGTVKTATTSIERDDEHNGCPKELGPSTATTTTTSIERDYEHNGCLKELGPNKELTITAEGTATTTTTSIERDYEHNGCLKELGPNKELTITAEGTVTTTTKSIERDNEHNGCLKELEPNKELTITAEGTATTTTTSIEMDNEHNRCLKEVGPNKELTITAEGTVTTTTKSIERDNEHNECVKELGPNKEFTITAECTATTTTTSIEMDNEHNRYLKEVGPNKELTITAEGIVTTTTRRIERDYEHNGCLKELRPNKELTITAEDVCAERKITKEKTHLIRLQDLFRVVNSVVMQKIEEEISDANLEMPRLNSAEGFLLSLSREKREDILCISGIMYNQLNDMLESTSSCKTIERFANNPVFKSSMNNSLVLLLRFWLFTNGQDVPTNDFEKMPSDSNDPSLQADLSRIYLTRKNISTTDLEFVGAWETVFKAVVRLGESKVQKKVSKNEEMMTKEPYSCSCKDNTDSFGSEQFTNEERSCTIQLDDWFLNDKPKHCALFATVIRNGFILSGSHFKENEITQETARFHQICRKYSLDCDQVAESLRDIPRNYVMKENNHYRIPQSMYNFLCVYFGRHTELQDLFLQFVDGQFFMRE